jgi:Spy/CpxP family protein refolding chaperone
MRSVRIVVAVAMAFLVVAMAVAQEKPKEQGRAARLSSTARAFLRFDRLRTAIEGLDLSAEQKEKLGKVREEFGPKMKALHDKLAETLTEDQRKAGEEAMKEAKDAGKKGREFFESLEAALKLTPEQKEKLAKFDPEIAELYKEHLGKVMEVLTPEQQSKVKERLEARGRKGGKRGEKKET